MVIDHCVPFLSLLLRLLATVQPSEHQLGSLAIIHVVKISLVSLSTTILITSQCAATSTLWLAANNTLLPPV